MERNLKSILWGATLRSANNPSSIVASLEKKRARERKTPRRAYWSEEFKRRHDRKSNTWNNIFQNKSNMVKGVITVYSFGFWMCPIEDALKNLQAQKEKEMARSSERTKGVMTCTLLSKTNQDFTYWAVICSFLWRSPGSFRKVATKSAVCQTF